MNLPEIKQRLHKAMVIRIPIFDPGTPPRQKVSALEDHILLCAFHRAECEEALYWCVEAGKAIRAQFEERTQGYNVGLKSRPTKEDVERARAELAPDLHHSLQEARDLVEALRRQVYRLGGSDYDAASRAYTLLSG